MDPGKLSTFFCLLCFVSLTNGQNKTIIGCYYTNWSQYRGHPAAKFLPVNINASLCTHVYYMYATIDKTALGLKRVETNDESYYFSITKLKSTNPGLKVLLTVGGGGVSADKWTAVSYDQQQAENFSQNAVAYLRQHRFDGFHMNWRAPTSRENYIRIVEAMRSAIDKEKLVDGRERLLMSVVVSHERERLLLFSPPQLAAAADYITIAAYDFYGAWSNKLGHHTPLYPTDAEPSDTDKSQHSAVQMWLDAGIHHDKLVLSVAAFGRTQKMNSSVQNRPGDPAEPALTYSSTIDGPITETPGAFTYFELCNLENENWTHVFIEYAGVPYVYSLDVREDVADQLVWISHDDIQSLTEKAHYAASRRLAGIMFWSLDNDDFTGTVCGQGKYPLLTTINNVLSEDICAFRTWGLSCSSCGHCKGPRPCDSDSGECPRGCLPGWSGPRCDLPSGSDNESEFPLIPFLLGVAGFAALLFIIILVAICCHRRRVQDRPSEAENNGEMPQMPVNIPKQKHNRSRDMSSQIGNQPASSKPHYDTFADVTHRPEINRSRDMSSQSANQPSSSMPHYDALADVTNRPESIASHLYDDLEDVRTDGNQVSKTPVLRVESGAYADISEATSGYNEHISRGFVAGNKNHFPATYLTPAP